MRELGPSDAYIERSKNPANRQRCDFCARCFVYNCDGSTAMHHEIHISIADFFALQDDGLDA